MEMIRNEAIHEQLSSSGRQKRWTTVSYINVKSTSNLVFVKPTYMTA